MTETEFRYKFDVLFNNIMSNAAPGLDDYEVSQILTKAQLELVKDYFNPKGNKYVEGFDNSPKRQADFSSLIQTDTLERSEDESNFDFRAIVFKFPTKFVSILNESLNITKNDVTTSRQIIPLSYVEYTRLMSKPYKEPLKRQAWRLLTGQGEANEAELILTTQDRTETNIEYKVRYVRVPRPIIVSDLRRINSVISIDGETSPRTSELNPELHEEILQRAVELAKAAYSSDQSGQAQMQNQITIGQRSE